MTARSNLHAVARRGKRRHSNTRSRTALTAVTDRASASASVVASSVFEALENRQLMSAGLTAVTLVNTDSTTDIGPLTSGMTLNLATLPTRQLNVRADVATGTGSVK